MFQVTMTEIKQSCSRQHTFGHIVHISWCLLLIKGNLWDGTCAWLLGQIRIVMFWWFRLFFCGMSASHCCYFIMSTQDGVVKMENVRKTHTTSILDTPPSGWRYATFPLWYYRGTNFITDKVNRAIIVYFLKQNVTIPKMQTDTAFIHFIIWKMQSSSSNTGFSINKEHNLFSIY